MTNYPIDDALSATEGTFEVDLLNKVTGTTYPQAAVYGTNTLGQVSASMLLISVLIRMTVRSCSKISALAHRLVI